MDGCGERNGVLPLIYIYSIDKGKKETWAERCFFFGCVGRCRCFGECGGRGAFVFAGGDECEAAGRGGADQPDGYYVGVPGSGQGDDETATHGREHRVHHQRVFIARFKGGKRVYSLCGFESRCLG